MAGRGSDDDAEANGDNEDLRQEDNDDKESQQDSACWSSDVTWGAADLDLATQEWADAYTSDETDDNDAHPFQF